MWRSEPELDNKPWTTFWEKDDFAGLDMSSVWTTSAYHSKHCTGRYQDTREDQVNQERTGGAWSAKTYERWGSPGRKQRWQLLTDTDGVGVWPNVSSWIRDESRSRSSSNTTSQLETGSELGRQVSNLHYVWVLMAWHYGRWSMEIIIFSMVL